MTFGSPRATSRVGNAVNVNALALNAPTLGSSADPTGAAYRRNTEAHTALVGEFKASAFTLTAFPTRDVARGDPNVTFGLLGSTSYRATP